MLKNYVPRTAHEEVEYSLEWTDRDGNGFSFPCDEAGNALTEHMTQAALNNLAYCKAHATEFWYAGSFHTRRYTVHDNAHGTCSCGREVYLYDEYYGACECECGVNESYSSYEDWKYGNFFETKEKAEQAAVDWIKEIVNQMVVEGKFALKLRCLTEEELNLWENVRGINPVLSVE